MNRLRWQIWVPRLLFVGVMLLAAQYGLGLFVRSVAVQTGGTALGTRVEIGSSRVALWDRKVVLNDLRVIDPRTSEDDLLAADRCELEFAPQPLMHKQAVVTHGRVSGLRFNAFTGDSKSASAFPEASRPIKWLCNDTDALTSQWLANIAERFKHDQLNHLDSMQQTEAFCANWSSQSAALEARGNELNDRLANLQKAVEAAQSNPLRGEKVLAALPQTIATLQKDFAELNADLARLPDQLESERRTIVAARRADEERLHANQMLEPVEANALSAYLLRAQTVKPLNELTGWLRWLRHSEPLAPAGSKTPSRGEDILFAGCRRAPNLLIKAVELQGAGRIAGQPVELRGTLTNLSTEPELADKPLQLRLQGTGSMPLELQAVMDRTRGAKRDAILLDCQGVLWPQLELGQPNQLALTIGPSLGSLNVSVAVDGEKLAGEIQMVQQNVRITPALAGEMADVPIGSSLEETLGRIDSLATRASIGGTLSEPTCTLWSNLGPAVAEAIEQALQRAGSQHARQMALDAGREVDERLTTVEQQMTEQQTRWSARFVDVQGQLHAIAASDIPRDRLSPERLGQRLPANSLFR